MNLDWRRLRAVVFESDDWGLCAWSPDEQARRVLASLPAFRSPAGRRYAGSTLEGADDVRRLVDTLLEFRGGDGFPPVWQANTVVAAPDYERLTPPLFDVPSLPLVDLPRTPSRWARPRLWEQVTEACTAGVWWPELHGLHHLPETAWLRALRRGLDDARRAHEQQSPVCLAVEASGEYDPSEPIEVRVHNLELAMSKFQSLVGRPPLSFCPPDYRWDDAIEERAEALGVTTLQGKAEQAGRALPRWRRLWHRMHWPHRVGRRLYMPARIAFEPMSSEGRSERLGPEATLRGAREAWSRGHPAVVSTHRLNYAHLDAAWSDAGRASLRELLTLLCGDSAVFLTDAEVRALLDQGWSTRPIGDRGVLVRYYGVPREPVRFPAPAGATGVSVREGRGAEHVQVTLVPGEVEMRANLGEYLLEWKRA
jgi:hypothetical protein